MRYEKCLLGVTWAENECWYRVLTSLLFFVPVFSAHGYPELLD